MKNIIIRLVLAFFMLLINLPFVVAQKKEQPTKQVMVEMNDGNKIQGTILEKSGDTVVLETATLGKLTLSTKNIKSIVDINPEQLKNGEYWFENPHATRNFFAPTGFGLHKGEGYYQNVMVVIHQVSYGFTDNFTVGAGFDIIGPITGHAPYMMYVTPKVSIPVSKNVHLGGGALLGTFGGDAFDGSRTTAGILYGVGTVGNTNHNATLGIGYGLENGNFAQRPVFMLGGQTRVGRKFSLMTENYFLSEIGLLTFGCRYMNTGFAFDFGVAKPLDFNGDFDFSFAFPYLSVSFPFGKKRI
jgi:hypothetical protein